MRKHWDVKQNTEYFHVSGHEWPTLLVEVAKWLVETNNAVDSIQMGEINNEEDYVWATVSYTSYYTNKCEDPLEALAPIVDIDEELFLDDFFTLLEKHGMVIQ